MSVSAPFVWRCLSGSAVAPFPHPAHRTGQADFPHPALGQDLTPSSRATPSAASKHHVELIGCPISMSFATFCVCLELRPLPSTRVTRFPRCRVGGGALSDLGADLRPPLKLDVQRRLLTAHANSGHEAGGMPQLACARRPPGCIRSARNNQERM